MHGTLVFTKRLTNILILLILMLDFIVNDNVGAPYLPMFPVLAFLFNVILQIIRISVVIHKKRS